MQTETKTTPHDHGLIRALGALGLAAAIANTVIGGGIFALPSAMAKAVGTAAPFYYIACAVAVGAVAVCFAEAGSRVSVSGGVSGGVEAAFGRYAGFITSVMIWLGSALAAAGIAAAIADAVAKAAPTFHDPIWRGALIAGLMATLAAINVRGVRAGSGLVILTVSLKLVPLLALVLLGGLHVNLAQITGGAPPKADIGRAMLLGVFAFMGMETALGVSGEVKSPHRNVPLGLLGALGAITILYILIQLVAEGLLGPELKSSATPLVDAAAKIHPALAGLLLVGAVVSMLGYMTSDILSAPRFLYGMARDGQLPSALARVNPATHTPNLAIATHAVLVGGLAISGAFAELVVLSTLVTVVAYIAGCLAAVRLQGRGVATHGAPLNFRFTGAAAAVGVISMVWLAFQGTWQEVAAVAAAIAIASVVYLIATRRQASAPPS